MNKYYKIPMTERVVSINDKTLFQTLQENYPELYDREKGRVELTYGGDEPGAITPQLECEIEKYNAETANLYHAIGVPCYLIGLQVDDGSVVEYVTGMPLETSYGRSTVLAGREVSQLEAYQYLDNESNYSEVASKMFAKKEEPKTFMKKVREVFLGK